MGAAVGRGTPHEQIHIDLGQKPPWFSELAPLGRVPLLRVRRRGAPERVLFESIAIIEFLADIHPDRSLYPPDALDRAEQRAWMLLAAEMHRDLRAIMCSREPADLDIAIHMLRSRFTRLERRLAAGPYFQGEAFGNVDAVFAPAFRQVAALDTVAPLHLFVGLPRLTSWSANILSRASVARSFPRDHDMQLIARLRASSSMLLEPERTWAA